MKSVLLIPTLNEEKTIVNVIEKAEKNVDKTIVIDGLSKDRTIELVKKNFPDVKILMEKRRGKGFALRKGFQEAMKYRPKYIITMDGDGERDPHDIKKLIKKIEENGVDMVIGSRSRMRSFSRKFFNRFTAWWVNLVTGYGLKDVLSGFVVVRSKAVKKMNLKSENFEIETEMLLEAKRNCLKVSEVPVKVPLFSKSGCTVKNMIQINAFFDEWVLNWISNPSCDISSIKKIFFKFFCTLGLFS
jgi:glycosyltransferase involved in cell wall biosynthesis